jgi:hypothetical protein
MIAFRVYLSIKLDSPILKKKFEDCVQLKLEFKDSDCVYSAGYFQITPVSFIQFPDPDPYPYP